MSDIDYNSKNYRGRYTGYVRHTIEKPSGRKDCRNCSGNGQVSLVVEGVTESRECVKCEGSGEGEVFIYGFIVPDDKSIDDVFAHHRDIEPRRQGFKELAKGDFVEFDVVETDRGPGARNIVIKNKYSPKRVIVRPGG